MKSPLPAARQYRFDITKYFHTALKVDEKKRTFYLKIVYEFHGSKKEVELECLDKLPEYRTWLPFAYDIIEMQAENRYYLIHPDASNGFLFDTYAVIRIVAGPGVSIYKTGFDSKENPSIFQPKVEIIRVQDPTLVPLQGYKINPANYSGIDYLPEDYWDVFNRSALIPMPYSRYSSFSKAGSKPIQVSPQPVIRGAAQKTIFIQDDSFFYLDVKIQPPIVMALPNGLYIIDVTTDSHIVIKVPTIGRESSRARFAYSIEYDGHNPTFIHIRKTRPVTISYLSFYRKAIADGDPFPLDVFPLGENRPTEELYNVIADKLEVRLSDGWDIFDIPHQGVIFSVDSHDEIKPVLPPLDQEIRYHRYLQSFIDVGASFIPYVSDAVDLAEFLSGHDKWGNDLTTLERAITGIGLLIPFVGAGILRTLAKPR
ncbi:hypothetical protein [Nitrosomonas communis]|uniref:Uncharacterized protein n=1 Tax=Nitrosomonas communis TaxID=44574 RepID=A0A1I4U0T5_9PROT|nr:hypothetical protein [Nitrosomonas communis]SFM82497.1 hypothetical protein SAMN05421863_105719 [Nitrosomonas communis]